MSEAADLAVRFQLDPTVDGLELARRWAEERFVGGFPERMKAWPVELERGRILLRCELDAGHSNFVGLVHGGLTAALVDLAGGGAAMTLLRPGEFLLSTDLTLRFLNAAPIRTGHLLAEGRAAYVDPRKVVADVRVTDPDGQVIVHGTAGVSIRRREA